MTHRYGLLINGTLLLMALCILGGCGSGSPATSTRVGSSNCTDSCHASTQDITGNAITAAWSSTTHTTDGGVQCEDCHGSGKDHQGIGPIPFPRPQAAQCNACHGLSGFDNTIHANSNPYNGSNINTFTGPDKFFFQGDASNSGPAEIRGVPEFFPDGVTPVTHAQHIQECSVCHNPNQRFIFNSDGTLAKPDPNNMPDPPNITCAGCHDAHQPEQKVTIAQRSTPVAYPVYRTFIVNPTGEQSFIADPSTGNESPTATSARLASAIFQPNGAVQADGSVDPTRVVGNNNELTIERLCASCHTVGKYLYSQQPTHQFDTYTQWTNSGHGTRSEPAFAEFSANPPAYINPTTGIPYAAGGHQSLWPYDMALAGGASFNGPGKVGATASTSRNAGFGGTNDNYPCYRCHNGIGSIAFQLNIQGTPGAPVIFGDEPVVCITCHDPHQNYPGQTLNVRQPVMMTNYSTASITIQGNVFLDNQPVPLDRTGNATICVYCHQGRESGLTLYATKLAPGTTITGSFFNPHYLGTAAMLWGANAYEYAGKTYSVNAAHQSANCPTCHMSNATADNKNGGHTWAPNVVTCNTADCHGGSLGPVVAKAGGVSPDVDSYRASSDTNNYTGEAGGETLSIAQSIQSLEKKVIALLQARGIFYNDTTYPYFFSDAGHTQAFTAWTPAAYKAAFDLSFVVKGLPSAASSQVLVPNASAAVHNYTYCIQLLLDAYADLNGSSLAGATRPPGSRPATVYGPGQ
ncbi:MAG TPA: hypothetical protein VEI46_08410 [Thermodesulfovibrionales bacterium]|nr:hypothetical protein [Thermodesulfovibrionales bacterium]